MSQVNVIVMFRGAALAAAALLLSGGKHGTLCHEYLVIDWEFSVIPPQTWSPEALVITRRPTLQKSDSIEKKLKEIYY